MFRQQDNMIRSLRHLLTPLFGALMVIANPLPVSLLPSARERIYLLTQYFRAETGLDFSIAPYGR